MAWILLFMAGLFEIAWAVALKHSEGFTKLWPSVIFGVTAWISFALLSQAIRTLPMGTAYAVWTGIGAVGIAGLKLTSGGSGIA
jgi:quaternary ammonium compound-resistance protein SugE